MYLCKRRDGSYIPYGTTDHEASGKIMVGGVVKATQSRNYAFHKKAFALLQIGYDNQNKFENLDLYRKVITIRAGYFDFADGHSIPHSLAFDKMNAETFERWFNATLEVICKDLDTAPENIRSEVEGFY